MRAATQASLGTVDAAGAPFVSLVAIADDGAGRPLLLVSGLAEHTKNLLRRPDASLLIAEGGETMDRARVTMTGKVEWLSGPDADAAKARFVERIPEARQWAALPDFRPARLAIEGVRWVGGFGRAATLAAADYLMVRPSEVLRTAAGSGFTSR